MKTPTLIVRLLGIYLCVSAIGSLIVIHKAVKIGGATVTASGGPFGEFQVFAWLFLIVGIVGVMFAGPLARVLTFDSEPREKSEDLSDQLLRRTK